MTTDPKEFPSADEHTKTIESRRAMLRQAIKQHPDDPRYPDALEKSLTSPFVRRAAQSGVFICYSNVDDVFALNLAIELRKAGVRAFMDELDVPDDEEWGDAVGQAMRDCGVLVLVLSPDALHDAEVQGERIYFLRTGKVILPIVARHCSTQGLEMIIEPLHFEDDFEGALQSLLFLLRQPRS